MADEKPSDEPVRKPGISRFMSYGARKGAILGAVGMLIYAFVNYENTEFGSTLVWSPVIALEGAIGGYIAGGILGFVCFLVGRVSGSEQ
jgi:hypothetical protein